MLGTIIAIMRVSPVAVFRSAGTAYVTLVRNTPLTLIVFFCAFGFYITLQYRLGAQNSPIDVQNFRWGVLGLAIYHAAFVAEALRSGINTVPKGQAEAARAIGLDFTYELDQRGAAPGVPRSHRAAGECADRAHQEHDGGGHHWRGRSVLLDEGHDRVPSRPDLRHLRDHGSRIRDLDASPRDSFHHFVAATGSEAMTAETSVLFDAPGPKARTRYRIIAVVGSLGILALLFLLVRALAAKGQFTADKWAPFIDPVTWTSYLLPGLRATLVAAFFSIILAIIGGILLGMGRLSQLKPVRMACGAFVEFFRAVPVLMMMLFAYYLFLFGFQISGEALPLLGVVAGLTFYNSSVIAELIRSGVGSLPKGQREAGLAIGLTPFATLRLVLLPQAITLMLPSIVSQLVVVLKDSALGFLILYPELVRSGQTLASLQGNLIPTFIVIAAMFIIINYLLTRLAHYLERRLQARRRGPKQPELETVMSPTLPGGALAAPGQI